MIDMKFNYKWALVIAPFVFAGCTDKLDQPQGPIASSGDDVIFSVDNTPASRTMYQDQWDEGTSQAIYWGNYLTGQEEFINIYCPDNPERGFAKYKITPSTTSPNVAETIVKQSEIGVQWGASGKPYTFYAFYPADKAGTTLSNDNTIRATVGTGQSPQVYKWKENDSEISTLASIGTEGFKGYNNDNFNSTSNQVIGKPKTLYGMPDMSAAVMVARQTMPADKFGEDVPLRFNVLADVLDITINGPVTPNTLGANKNPDGTGGQSTNSIQIQAVTIEVVNPVANTPVDEYEIDDSTPISGSFDLNMSQEAADAGTMVDKNSISGNPTIQLQTSMTNADGGVYYPTLFVRGDSHASADIDHLRLRAFLIPGQVTGDNLKKIRVHLQTNCGDFYQMLEDDANFVTGKIYPVKFGYFETRGVDFNLGSWIGQLDPNIYISELSIPGAWHAANSVYQGGKTLKEMYDAGVRAFEVHTKNGSRKMQYGNFDTDFTLTNATENFEQPFVREGTTTDRVMSDINITSTGAATGNTWIGTRRRPVSGTATVSYTVSQLEYTVPKFWLRLFRTSDTADPLKSTPLSTAIIELANNMNKDGLMFLEVGMDGQSSLSGVDYRSVATVTTTYSVRNVPISGTESLGSGDTPTGNYSWSTDLSAVDFTGATATTETSTDNTAGTFTLTGGEAWSIAVRSCLERLLTETNPSTQKPVLFKGNLSPTTTISDVQGQVIAKINTNDRWNEESFAWGTDCPALFSRWISGSANTPLTINLKWKSPVAPYDGGNTGVPDTELRWCFSEIDNIDGGGSSIQQRKDAIVEMNTIAAQNYAGGLHRTFYESAIGGYTGGANSPTAADCQDCAQQLNTFALSRITDPTRQAVPLGLVFMNYVIPPTGEESTYNSAALIRAIINNNKAFILNRRSSQDTPAVENNVNSHFNNNTNNPLK